MCGKLMVNIWGKCMKEIFENTRSKDGQSNFSLNSVHFKEKLCVVYISEDAINTLFEDNSLQ